MANTTWSDPRSLNLTTTATMVGAHSCPDSKKNTKNSWTRGYRTLQCTHCALYCIVLTTCPSARLPVMLCMTSSLDRSCLVSNFLLDMENVPWKQKCSVATKWRWGYTFLSGRRCLNNCQLYVIYALASFTENLLCLMTGVHRVFITFEGK